MRYTCILGAVLLYTFPTLAEIKIQNAWVRPASKGKNSALYMQIINDGKEGTSLVGVKTDIADRTQMHTTVREGETAGMRNISEIPCPPGVTTKLKAGGLHIMLRELALDLEAGKNQTVPITLKFSNGQKIKLDAPVKKSGCCGTCQHKKAQGHTH